MKTCCMVLLVLSSLSLRAQDPISEIIRQGIKKVIVAVDLKIQRLQNRTIWLQNLQKTLENKMSKLQLRQIADWVEKQRKQYADYFEELEQVKTVLLYLGRLKDIISQQKLLVQEYQAAWSLFKRDDHFTDSEKEYMLKVYTGMLNQTGRQTEQLGLVIRSFVTKMSDAQRLALIGEVGQAVEQTLMDLRSFNENNKLLSLYRATEGADLTYIKKLYGL